MPETGYRKPSRSLQARIDAHGEWLRTEGCSGKQLNSAGDFSGLDLKGANLARANLSTADFYQTNLCRANLSGADLSGARLVETDLRDADMSSANLVLACLRGAHISGTRFEQAKTELTVWPQESTNSSLARNLFGRTSCRSRTSGPTA